MRRAHDRGFTLVELLVVVVVLSVLLAIAIPQFTAARTRAHDAAARTDLRTAFTAAAAVRAGTAWPDAAALAAAEPSLRTTTGSPAPGTLSVATGTNGIAMSTLSRSGTCWRVTGDSTGLATWTSSSEPTCPAAAPVVLTYPDQTFTAGQPDSLAPAVTGGVGAARTYTVTAGTLPGGVTLDPSTGVLTSTGVVPVSGGTLDTTFANGVSGANGAVRAMAVQADGRVVVAGSFTSVNGTARNRVARLNTDGTLDTTFLNGLTGANDTVQTLAVQADGRIVIGGGFNTVNGTVRWYVARLNTDGSLDTGFQNGMAGADLRLYAVAVQSDGRIVIGGNFTTVNGTARGRVARLNTDGSLDTSFANGLAGADDSVFSIAIAPDGKVVIGGAFANVHGTGRTRLARLNTDGTLDAAFMNGLAGPSWWVWQSAVLADGRVVIAGEFTSVHGTARGQVARLNTDGTLDTTFLNGLAGTNATVHALSVRPDGAVLLGGFFTSVNGTTRGRVARLGGASGFPATVTIQLDEAGAAPTTVTLTLTSA